MRVSISRFSRVRAFFKQYCIQHQCLHSNASEIAQTHVNTREHTYSFPYLLFFRHQEYQIPISSFFAAASYDPRLSVILQLLRNTTPHTLTHTRPTSPQMIRGVETCTQFPRSKGEHVLETSLTNVLTEELELAPDTLVTTPSSSTHATATNVATAAATPELVQEQHDSVQTSTMTTPFSCDNINTVYTSVDDLIEPLDSRAKRTVDEEDSAEMPLEPCAETCMCAGECAGKAATPADREQLREILRGMCSLRGDYAQHTMMHGSQAIDNANFVSIMYSSIPITASLMKWQFR